MRNDGSFYGESFIDLKFLKLSSKGGFPYPKAVVLYRQVPAMTLFFPDVIAE